MVEVSARCAGTDRRGTRRPVASKGQIMMKKSNHDGNTKRQSFAFTAPTAMSVQLVGDFTHWKDRPISMQKDTHGVWRASVALDPGEHHYRFLVDGEWRDDPECSVRVPNPFGSQDAIRQVA